eukprot:1518940-Pleurochrysis_carterae.AAC.1
MASVIPPPPPLDLTSPPPGAGPTSKERSAKQKRNNSFQKVNAENTPPAANHTPTLNRFGFKKRSATGCLSDSAAAQAAQPVELLSIIEATIGNLDVASKLLRTKVTSDSMKYDYKAKVNALGDMVKQLKSTLSDHVKRARSISDIIIPLQEDINSRLLTLAEEAYLHRSAADKLKIELSAARQQSEGRAKSVQGLEMALHTAQTERSELAAAKSHESVRANTAETSLKECTNQLATIRQEVEGLRELTRVQKEELAESLSRQQQLRKDQEQAMEAAASAAEEQRAAGEQREAALQTELNEALRNAKELGGQLDVALSEKEALTKLHESLTSEHAAVSRSLEKRTSTVGKLELELESLKSSIAQKEDELRDSIKSVNQMQQENSEQMMRERQAVHALELEVQSLRASEAGVRAELASCKADAERVAAD